MNLDNEWVDQSTIPKEDSSFLDIQQQAEDDNNDIGHDVSTRDISKQPDVPSPPYQVNETTEMELLDDEEYEGLEYIVESNVNNHNDNLSKEEDDGTYNGDDLLDDDNGGYEDDDWGLNMTDDYYVDVYDNNNSKDEPGYDLDAFSSDDLDIMAEFGNGVGLEKEAEEMYTEQTGNLLSTFLENNENWMFDYRFGLLTCLAFVMTLWWVRSRGRSSDRRDYRHQVSSIAFDDGLSMPSMENYV